MKGCRILGDGSDEIGSFVDLKSIGVDASELQAGRMRYCCIKRTAYREK